MTIFLSLASISALFVALTGGAVFVALHLFWNQS